MGRCLWRVERMGKSGFGERGGSEMGESGGALDVDSPVEAQGEASGVRNLLLALHASFIICIYSIHRLRAVTTATMYRRGGAPQMPPQRPFTMAASETASTRTRRPLRRSHEERVAIKAQRTCSELSSKNPMFPLFWMHPLHIAHVPFVPHFLSLSFF